MFNPFKRRVHQEDMDDIKKCHHDWETVSYCTWLLEIIPLGLYEKQYGKHFIYSEDHCSRWPDNKYSIPFPTIRRVCLKCGACQDTISEASDYIHKEWDRHDAWAEKWEKERPERDRREKLAKKMWENCRGQ